MGDLIGPFVYVVTCGAYVKIGYSATPVERVRDVLTECLPPGVTHAADGELRAVLLGDIVTEHALHAAFADHAAGHEWFRIDPPVQRWLERLPPYSKKVRGRPRRAGAAARRPYAAKLSEAEAARVLAWGGTTREAILALLAVVEEHAACE